MGLVSLRNIKKCVEIKLKYNRFLFPFFVVINMKYLKVLQFITAFYSDFKSPLLYGSI